MLKMKTIYKYSQKVFFLFLGAMMLSACSRKELSPDEYIQWYNEHPSAFISEVSQKGFSFELKYEPLDYILLKESNGNPDEKFMETRKKEIEDYTFFTLRIKADKKNNPENNTITNEESGLSENNGMLEDNFFLINSTDTIPCVMALLENNNGISPYSAISLSFPISNSSLKSDKVRLVYNDYLLGAGKVTLNINNIDNLPTLKNI